MERKTIFVIIGSAGRNSANQKLVDIFIKLNESEFDFKVLGDLKTIPHFDPELAIENPPKQIIELRNDIENTDGILICTPEYIFSIPGGLKNVLEWCVSTTVFSEKPVGIITASAHGQKGHEELQMILQTLMARISDETSLLIQGIKGKISEPGEISDKKTREDLSKFIAAFRSLVDGTNKF